MECPRCHAQNPDDASFCDECGSRIEVKCPSCGEPNRPSAKFCRKCGKGLAAVTDAGARSQANSETPDRYTPKHLAERILYSRAAMEGER
jgi:ribosomal protein L40E